LRVIVIIITITTFRFPLAYDIRPPRAMHTSLYESNNIIVIFINLFIVQPWPWPWYHHANISCTWNLLRRTLTHTQRIYNDIIVVQRRAHHPPQTPTHLPPPCQHLPEPISLSELYSSRSQYKAPRANCTYFRTGFSLFRFLLIPPCHPNREPHSPTVTVQTHDAAWISSNVKTTLCLFLIVWSVIVIFYAYPPSWPEKILPTLLL
jgi:hypothetical protein